MAKKTYLNEIMEHYFDVQDLNEVKWQQDDEGFYTTDIEEIEWFQRLNKAYDNISQDDLVNIEFNDYDEIIGYYEGSL